MIVISISLRVPADLRREFLVTIKDLIAGTRAEQGVLAYTFAEDVDVKNLFRVFEVYENQGALDAHMQSPHFQAWRAASAPYAREDRWLLDAKPR